MDTVTKTSVYQKSINVTSLSNDTLEQQNTLFQERQKLNNLPQKTTSNIANTLISGIFGASEAFAKEPES